MVDVRRVTLPGVGVLHSFTTGDGSEIAVVAHRTGSSDLVSRPAGAHSHGHDEGATTVRLDEDEARTLADLLGGTRIVESITELDELPGVPIDWVTVEADDAIAGRTVGELPAASGVVLVAVVRDDHAHPSPAADFVIAPGDTLVVVGPRPGIESVFRAVHRGDAHPLDAEA
ncbi:cation:proton antiporter regulatory subunit [Agromyces bauzanensis]